MRTPRLSLIAILVAIGLVGSMRPALAASTDETDFSNRINSARSSHGRAALAFDSGLADIARRHSQDMANRNELYHNENIGNEVSGWQALGENVGEGGSVAEVHDAFMNSPEHRDNILGDYTKLGVGVVWKDGTLWVTEVFELPEHQSQPAPTMQPKPPYVPPSRTTAAPARRTAPPARPGVRAAGGIPLETRSISPMSTLAARPARIRTDGDLIIVPPAEESDAAGDDAAPLGALRNGGEAGLEALVWQVAAEQDAAPPIAA